MANGRLTYPRFLYNNVDVCLFGWFDGGFKKQVKNIEVGSCHKKPEVKQTFPPLRMSGKAYSTNSFETEQNACAHLVSVLHSLLQHFFRFFIGF